MIENDWNKLTRFLLSIPHGQISTYARAAEVVFKNRAKARYVGWLLKNNPIPEKIPCYKIVRSDGTLGGYFGTKKIAGKKKLLKREGIQITGNKIKNFEKVFWLRP